MMVVCDVCMRLNAKTTILESHLVPTVPRWLTWKMYCKISAFLKSFAGFIFLLQKSGWSYNSGSTVSQTLWLYKRVNSRFHDIIFSNSAERVPYFVTYVLKCYESTRSLNVFYIQYFPVIQSVNMSTFPWYLMWLLFHNKVGTGTGLKGRDSSSLATFLTKRSKSER